jgi:hypothetical protein
LVVVDAIDDLADDAADGTVDHEGVAIRRNGDGATVIIGARVVADLDHTTLAILAGWKALQGAEFAAVGINSDGWVSPPATTNPGERRQNRWRNTT